MTRVHIVFVVKVILVKTGQIEETGENVSASHIIPSKCKGDGAILLLYTSPRFHYKSPDLSQQ